jgi:Holliday junction DNA helicase RuvA
MIAFIRGELCEKGPDHAIIDASGVGYYMSISLRCAEMLGAVGSQQTIYTYLAVREDAMKLYGFSDRDELDMFTLLISVNKVGPKGAQDILSHMSPSQLRMAILSDDTKALASCPGVGAKTAQRIVLDLKDKVDIETALTEASSGAAPENLIESGSLGGASREAVEALIALGFPSSLCMKAVSQINGADGLSTEEIIKEALKIIR